jgi:thiol-disulfide isomerase/thioredoxin
MKFLIKNLALFVFFSVVFSGLTSCSKSADAPVNNVEVANSNSLGDPKKNEFPPVAPAVMQTELKSLDGSTFKLEDYKGKVVLVNFWATWCGPCKAEMPELIKMQNEHHEKGFEIIGLDADENEDADMIKAFGEKMQLNYKLGMTDRKLYGEFLKITRMDAVPQSFLIDREGKLNGAWVGSNKIGAIKESVAKLMNPS